MKRISRGQAADIVRAAAVIALGAGLVWAGSEAAAGAAAAVRLCLTVMIPSLFAFTAASAMIISSGAYKLPARLCGAASRYLLRMPEEHFAVFVIGQMAGYPVGAALISGMYSRGSISKEQAEELLCFCIAPGPAYIMAVTRAAAPEHPELRRCVMLSVLGANLAAALISAPFRKIPPREKGSVKVRLSAEDLTEAVRSACGSMSMICGMIIFMAAVMGIAEKAGVLMRLSEAAAGILGTGADRVYPFVRSFFEISGLTGLHGRAYEILPAAAGMLSFGGICVHLQINAVSAGFSAARAILMRIPCALCAAVLCRLLMPRGYAAEAVAVSAELKCGFGGYSPILSLFLLIMTILILSQKSMVKNRKM